MKPDRFAPLREAGVAAVAARLGLDVDGATMTPCPECGAVARGARSRRKPVAIVRDGLGWVCYVCDARGDAVTIAALRTTGQRKPASWAPVLALLDGDVALRPLPPRRLTLRERRQAAYRRRWGQVLDEARGWMRGGLYGEPCGTEGDPVRSLAVALACRAAVAGWSGDEVWDAATEYAASRLAVSRDVL